MFCRIYSVLRGGGPPCHLIEHLPGGLIEMLEFAQRLTVFDHGAPSLSRGSLQDRVEFGVAYVKRIMLACDSLPFASAKSSVSVSSSLSTEQH